jgi:hypothetical protein
MPIPVTILNERKCFLNEDGNIVHDPVLLQCGFNAFRECCSDQGVPSVKCLRCHKNDLFHDLNLKVKSGLDLLLFHLNFNLYQV